MRSAFKWERIACDNLGVSTWRAKLIGGWLVNHIIDTINDQNASQTMVFVPDAEHKWNLQDYQE